MMFIILLLMCWSPRSNSVSTLGDGGRTSRRTSRFCARWGQSRRDHEIFISGAIIGLLGTFLACDGIPTPSTST